MKSGGIRKKRDNKYISVVTVNYNDAEGLERTLQALFTQEGELEIVVIDGGSTDGSVDILEKYNDQLDYWVSEKDKGIYDGMNKGLDQITGEFHVFINSGDYLEGQVLPSDVTEPCFIPVKFIDYRGVDRFVTVRDMKKGIPYCHQGMVFRTQSIRYDISFNIAADYKYYMEHSSKAYFPYREMPGFIRYDNTGMSAQNFFRRDKEVGQLIREYYGLKSFVVFRFQSAFKSAIKYILR